MSDTSSVLIPEELFACAESAKFSGYYNLEVIDAGPDSYRFDAPLDWSVAITNTGDALLVEGEVSGVAKTDCARCLDELKIEIAGDVEGFFLIRHGDEAPAGMDEDEYDYLPEDKTIDMKPLLDAAILLEIPLIPVCKEECKGLCPTCGENLNEGECSCIQDDDGFEKEKNPFSVLEAYSFE